MGEAWRFRSTFRIAKELLHAQDAWCSRADKLRKHRRLKELEGDRLPFDYRLQNVVGTFLQTASY